ncbi:MAG: hypothetical protein L6R35_002866 [Caloplaca aegaea]|nr:MAG: hypothetical protein L6R35_002866 [Caloplaca aegaea]
MASIAITSSNYGDSSWQLVNSQRLGRTGKHEAQVPSIRQRRGHTDANKRLSLLKMRSRSNTSLGHLPSPSLLTNSQRAGHDDTEEARLESGWSDSDHSDSPTKSWVAKGSKMLKKQNSKFSLSSSRRSTWVEETDEVNKQHPEVPLRNSNKHGRMYSTGSNHPVRPGISISRPYNFQHLTHTQAHQFTDLHRASQHKLISDFSAIRAAQEPQMVLQGIPTEDVRSPNSQPSRPASREPVTPPSLSPTKHHILQSTRPSSIRLSERLSRSRSMDNFSQPSPRAYRSPPATSPARSSPRNATHPAFDFFSEVHHATPEERELLSQHSNPNDVIGLLHGPALHDRVEDRSLPHAITTSDDIALTLKPSPVRRNTLFLADVPEEDELRSIRPVSNEGFRPVTADVTLRHVTSFPSTGGSMRCRRASRLSGVLPVERFQFQEYFSSLDSADEADVSMRCRMSQRISPELKGIDPCWEEDIDYCYQHEAEADCEFDWDRGSMDDTLKYYTSAKVEARPQASLQTSEKLDIPAHGWINPANNLPRLQTSLPELTYSTTNSAKSSMASLRGPLTPSKQLPSPHKIRPALQSSRSTDALNMDSLSDCNLTWIPKDTLAQARSWDHANNFNYPFNNLIISGSSTRTSLRSSRPTPRTSRSSDYVMLSASSSTAPSRRNTSSSGSLPELVYSKNHQQQAIVVTEEVADMIAALPATNAHDMVESTQSHTNTSKNGLVHSPLRKDPTISGTTFGNRGQGSESSTDAASMDPILSVASFANKLRSTSIASSSSGSSSKRTSRASYSLFPSVASARA